MAQVIEIIKERTCKVCSFCARSSLRTSVWNCTECGVSHCRACAASPISLVDCGKSGVCNRCVTRLLEQVRAARSQELLKRVVAFGRGTLQPYAYSPESTFARTVRIGSSVLSTARQMTNYLPVGKATSVIRASWYLVRFGPLVLASGEIISALQLLLKLAQKAEVSRGLKSCVVTPVFYGGLYYMMAERWAERGRSPRAGELDDTSSDGLLQPDAELLSTLRKHLRLLSPSKQSTPTDVQRLLKHVVPDAELIVAKFSESQAEPTFFLAASRRRNVAFLLLPGTRNPADFATDMDAQEEPFADGFGHRGMVLSTHWLLERITASLLYLHGQGYTITVVGHSLGAGVGAMLTLHLRSQIPSIFCYGFGTPSCVDKTLVPAAQGCMVSVVNRDDVVPRLTVPNISKMIEKTLSSEQVSKTKRWMSEDCKSMLDVERVAGLRQRTSAVVAEVNTRALPKELLNLSIVELRIVASFLGLALPTMVKDHMVRRICRGDSDLLESVEASLATKTIPATRNLRAAASQQSLLCEDATDAESWVRLHVPGRIVYLHRQNGLSRASWVSCQHKTLSELTPSMDIIFDHEVSAYEEALRQASFVPSLTDWESFDDREVCACCQADFSWAIVLQSYPQRMLARKHCFVCGRVVCGGCSERRLPHPEIGFTEAVRTCDKCFFSRGVDSGQEDV